MKAISIRQPWAWFILHGGKRIENRSWRAAYRGPVLIHASSWWQADEVYADFVSVRERRILPPGLPSVSLNDLKAQRGGIVGRARIVDCVTASDSPWFMGPFGFVLEDVEAVPFRARRGALGFFDVAEYER